MPVEGESERGKKGKDEMRWLEGEEGRGEGGNEVQGKCTGEV